MGSILSKVLASPTIKVTKIKLRGVSPLSGKVFADITLSITNPNPITLRAKSFHYHIIKRSDKTEIAEGSGEPFVARGNGHITDVITPVKLSFGGIGAAGKSLVLRGRTDIMLSGKIVFESPVSKKHGSVTVPFCAEQVIVME